MANSEKKVDSNNWFKQHKILTVILALFVIGIIGAMIQPDDDNTAVEDDNQQASQQSTDDSATRAELKPIADSVVVENAFVSAEPDGKSYNYIWNVKLESDKKQPYSVKVSLLDTDGKVDDDITYELGDEEDGNGNPIYSRRTNFRSFSYPVGVTHGWIQSYKYSVTIDGQTFEYPEQKISTEIEQR
jgi:hypothetical protein